MTPKQAYAQARALAEEQREARGWTKGPDVKIEGTKVPTLQLGRYEATPENEGRAWLILYLRRAAARTEHPLP